MRVLTVSEIELRLKQISLTASCILQHLIDEDDASYEIDGQENHSKKLVQNLKA